MLVPELTSCEKAQVCKRLRDDHGLSRQQIADKTGLSRSHVSYLLSLASTPEAIFTMVKNGQVSGQLAVRVVRQFGDKAHEILLGLQSEWGGAAGLERTEALETRLLELAQKYGLQNSTTESPVEDEEQDPC
ncbi:TPA: helix-turn-helix domain-containing protein [Pseudomonas aeruginosa]